MRSDEAGSGEVPSTRPLSVRTVSPPAEAKGDPVAADPPECGGRPPCAGEDLVRTHGVERLEPLEGDDHDVTLQHAFHSGVRRGWRQRPDSHKLAIAPASGSVTPSGVYTH